MFLHSLEEFPNLRLLVYPGGDESYWLKKEKAETEKREKGRIPLLLSQSFSLERESVMQLFCYNLESVKTKFQRLDKL